MMAHSALSTAEELELRIKRLAQTHPYMHVIQALMMIDVYQSCPITRPSFGRKTRSQTVHRLAASIASYHIALHCIKSHHSHITASCIPPPPPPPKPQLHPRRLPTEYNRQIKNQKMDTTVGGVTSCTCKSRRSPACFGCRRGATEEKSSMALVFTVYRKGASLPL